MTPPPTPADVPPAPPEALAEDATWGGRRCACGLPVLPSGVLSTHKREVLVHLSSRRGAVAVYLNEHPHNVKV